MVTVKEISDYINTLAPYNTKCEWDNCGLLVGDESKQVAKIGFALDLTEETLSDAIKNKVDMIVTHHPIIFKAQKSFLKGNMAYELAYHGICAVSAHTCFDCAEGGVNDVLCEMLELSDVEGVPTEECSEPLVRIGTLGYDNLLTSEGFAKIVAEKLGTTVRLVEADKGISRVAVCGGAGMDFIFDAVKMGADAYVTGDMSYHEALDAKSMGITVVAAGHFETENPAIAYLKKYIEEKFSDVETVLLKQSTPIKFIG